MKKKNRMIARPAEPADQRCWTRIPCLPEYRAEITDSSGRPQSVTVEEISVAGATLRSSQGLNVALGDTLQVSFSSVTLSATVQNVAREPNQSQRLGVQWLDQKSTKIASLLHEVLEAVGSPLLARAIGT